MSDHECGSNPELTCIHERCNCGRRENIVNKCHENCVGKQACVQLIRNAEAKAAEKAKADKLAMLNELDNEILDEVDDMAQDVVEAVRSYIQRIREKIEAE